jgi:hypothetical protein
MRKIVSVVALLALLFFMVAGAGSLAINTVNAEGSGTSVKGIISTNTTWTLANSPYNLTGPILVNRSAVLTIEPGVVVYFKDYFIQVDGVLNARGDEAHPIRFSGGGWENVNHSSLLFTNASAPWEETTESGCIIDYAVINLFESIKIRDSSPRISNSLISGTGQYDAIWVDSGSPLILNNTIRYSLGGAGMRLKGGSPLIIGNTITYNDDGVVITYGSPKIYQNKIVLNSFNGIRVETNTQVFIVNNTISENGYGLDLYSYSSSSKITYNNIVGNKEYDVRLSNTPNDVNMTYNWWGTTDTSLIDQHIYDFYDDFRLGKVIYTPFLNAPSPGAPAWEITPPTIDKTPPTIESVVRTPQGDIQPDQKVTIDAKVTDTGSGVKEVLLLYSLDGGASWITVPMSIIGTSGPWEGTIPGQPAGTQVLYKVMAYDNAGNYATTPTTTLQIQSSQNPSPPTPLTPQIIILILIVILAAIFAIGISILKLRKRKSTAH